MTDSSPWDEIAIPGSDFNVRQVAGKMTTPCFWGRDSYGACLFIVELKGDHSAQYRKNIIRVKGINIDLRGSEKGQQRLILTLDRQADRDLFEGLCRTLAMAIEHASDSASSLAISMVHIRRWKAFLSGNSQHLSAEEVRGLFAELVFLREFLDHSVSSTSAVSAWLGPEKSQQDFIYGNTAVEIKSLSGVERNSVRISSEDQLESLNDSLFLRVYRLSSLPESPAAQSLNEIVAKIQSALSDATAIEEFDRKLVAQGYAPLPDYDEPRFVISEVSTFRVKDDFPKLIRSALPEGITKVSYEIKLETIDSFLCDNDMIFAGNQ